MDTESQKTTKGILP